MPPADEMKTKLVAAGVSDAAAAGLVDIGEKYRSQVQALIKGDDEAGWKLFNTIKAESDAYIATQPETDQTAYNAFVEKTKANFQAYEETSVAESA
ncbi:Minor capsid protein [Caenorhabditis elegans]|nr:Minor capsid protein [Caenorhabditis elegans]CCM09416.1 Minor capsid protein [Caenorhabditis elegans]|eukprot:NP_001263907.1 Uncharacterized protein CELE_F57E7.1 [Caenorhabditis elegans]